jgi:hypothetical protein
MIHTEHGAIGVDWSTDGKTLDITIKSRGSYKQAEMNVGEDGVPSFTVYDYPPNPELEISLKVEDIQILISMLERARQAAYDVGHRRYMASMEPNDMCPPPTGDC